MEITRAGKDTSHSSARREACSEDAERRRPFVGRKGGLHIVLKKKIHVGKKVVKTVRLSYVLLDSGKFIFLLFYVYYKFSVMNMYFLNQENKTKKNWRRSVFTNAGSSFFLLNYHFSFD